MVVCVRCVVVFKSVHEKVEVVSDLNMVRLMKKVEISMVCRSVSIGRACVRLRFLAPFMMLLKHKSTI